MRVSKESIRDYTVLFMLLCVSGNPVFSISGAFSKVCPLLFFLFLIAVYWKTIKKRTILEMVAAAASLALIFAFQRFILGYVSIKACANYIVKFLSAIIVAHALGARFKDRYIRIMGLLAAVSLFFFTLEALGIKFPPLFHTEHNGDSILIHNYLNTDASRYGRVLRNCGMFWEPGVFSGYLILALVLFANRPFLLLSKYKIQLVVIILAVVTTKSTSGYLMLFLVGLYILYRSLSNRISRLVLVTVLALGTIIAVINTPFLGDKIANEIESIEDQDPEDINFSRLGSFVFDLQYIGQHPLFGNGLAGKTRYALHNDVFDLELLQAFSNGFSGCAASMGLLFLVTFFVLIGINPTLSSKAFLIISVILLLQGEYFLSYSLFMALPFIDYSIPSPSDRTCKEE